MSGGRSPKNKGGRFELEVVRALQVAGLAAEKMPLSGALGGKYASDISCPVRGQDKRLECKRRARAFSTLYGFLNGAYAAVVRDDRTEPLVVMRLSDWAELAREARPRSADDVIWG